MWEFAYYCHKMYLESKIIRGPTSRCDHPILIARVVSHRLCPGYLCAVKKHLYSVRNHGMKTF